MTAESTTGLCLSASDEAAGKTTLALDNRGLAYGDGFFTTMGVIDGQILWQDYHVQRLSSHAQALQLDVNSQNQMGSIVARLQAHAEQLSEGVMKLIVTRVPQAVRGYGFIPNTSGSACDVSLKTTAMSINTTQHAHLPDARMVLMQPATNAICLTAQLACLPPPLAGLKSLNRLDSVLASGELQAIKATSLSSKSSNIGEGLLRDMTGNWVEGTMSNVFYQLSSSPLAGKLPSLSSLASSANSENSVSNYLLSGQWFTPSLTQSGVTGVLRQVVLDAFAQTENPVIMRSLQDDDLPNLRGLFFCNAVRGVMPVTSLTLLSGEVLSF